MSHTPGPWHIMPGDVVPGVPGLGIFGVDGTAVATVHHTFKDRERDNANLINGVLDLLEACEIVAGRTAEVQAMMTREGFVIDDLDDRWQKFAFTLYSLLAADAGHAKRAVAQARGKHE